MKKLILLFAMVVLATSCDVEKITTLPSISKTIKGNGIIKEEIREVGPYHAITLKGSYDVILTDEPQGKLRLVGEENINPIVLTEVKNGHLEISTTTLMGYSTTKRNVIYVPSQKVSRFELKGSGDIKNQGKINTPHLQIVLSGSGDIQLRNISTEKADISLLGSGDIDLSGNAVQISTFLKGSGDISAFQLITKEAKVELHGSGNAEVFANELFIGELRGSGDIKVKGHPKHVSKNRKGSGSIKIL